VIQIERLAAAATRKFKKMQKNFELRHPQLGKNEENV